MSAAAVRAAFRAKVSTLLVAEGFTFVESVNRAESSKDLPDTWFTLDFAVSNNERTSLGVPARFMESGRVMVFLFTPQQQLDTTAVNAAEVVRAAMANWFDPTGFIRVTVAQPPADLDGGDFRGSFYGITVDLPYTFESYA